jgi:hypothetical protein
MAWPRAKVEEALRALNPRKAHLDGRGTIIFGHECRQFPSENGKNFVGSALGVDGPGSLRDSGSGWWT